MHLLKSATLLTASETFQADLLIEGEKIAAIGQNLQVPSAETLDCTGKLIMPGGVDPHCHFALPMFDTISSDDHYTGHKAAAFGGTTTVMDFVPHDLSPLEANVERWHEKADSLAGIDFGFHMNITPQRGTTALKPETEAEIPRLLDLGIPTLKVFMAYNGRLRLQDGEIFRVLQIAREHGMLVMLHAENGDVIENLTADAIASDDFIAGHSSPVWHARTRPAWGAVEATLRGCALAAQADSPLYIVHMNASGEVDMLQYARERGAPVMGETCPQYLFFTENQLAREDGAKWICSPPMRTEADQERLWTGLKHGALQTIGTDHCPFFYDGAAPIEYEGESIAIPGKELGLASEGRHGDFTKIPNGLPMVGDRMPILWTCGVRAGRLTPNRFVALTSTNPAKIFGLYPRKGALLPGSDADIVIWDPEKLVQYGLAHAHHRTDYNLFEGWELTGFPEKVFLRGQMIVDGDQWLGRKGMGQFLIRSSCQFL